MPQETIRDEAGMFDVRVGWTTHRWVQVGIESADGVPIVTRLNAGGDDGSDPAEFTGLWGTLDREGCNRLIRAVRNARDAAYGKDA